LRNFIVQINIKGEIPPQRKVHFFMKTSHAICISILFAIFILTSGLIIYIIVLGAADLQLGSNTQDSSLSASYSAEEILPDELYSYQDAANNIGKAYHSSGTTWGQDKDLSEASSLEGIPSYEETTSNGETSSHGDAASYASTTSYSETTSYGSAASSDTDYVNDWIGIKFTAPDDYIMLTKEEMAAIAGAADNLVTEDLNSSEPEYSEVSTGGQQEMMCMSPTGFPNVNVEIIPLPSASLTIDQLIEATKLTIGKLSSVDITIDDTVENVSVAGKEFAKLHATINIPSVEDLEKSQDYYFVQKGDQVFIIYLTYLKGETGTAATLMNGFQAK
jgi:hypothetical protein